MPRKEGMERKDLLKANTNIFKVQGAALDKFAKKTVKASRLTGFRFWINRPRACGGGSESAQPTSRRGSRPKFLHVFFKLFAVQRSAGGSRA